MIGELLKRHVAYANGGRLPAGYTELKWINNQGKTWIDTNFCPNPKTTKSNIIFEIIDAVNTPSKLFGCREGNYSKDNYNIFFLPGNKLRLDSSDPSIEAQITLNTIIDMTLFNNICIINGQEYSSEIDKADSYLTQKILIGSFDDGRGGVIPCANVNIYSCKIWDGENLLFDLKPCKNDEDVSGMYDLKSDKFFDSPNKNSFISGTEI